MAIYAKGYTDRLEHQRTLVAWQTAMLVNVHLPRSKHVTVARLMGGKKGTRKAREEAAKQPRRFENAEDLSEYYRAKQMRSEE